MRGSSGVDLGLDGLDVAARGNDFILGNRGGPRDEIIGLFDDIVDVRRRRYLCVSEGHEISFASGVGKAGHIGFERIKIQGVLEQVWGLVLIEIAGGIDDAINPAQFR